MTLRPSRLVATPTHAGTARSHYGIGLSRPATVIALLLSLLVHVAFIIALLRPEPAPEASERVDVVSVHLVPAQPAAAASEPALPSAPLATRSAEQMDEIRRQGNSAPRLASEPNTQHAIAHRATYANRLLPDKARIAPQPAPKAETAAPTPHFDESPENRAANSLADYLRLLAMRLAEVKQYPAAAVAQREQGEVLVGFRLDRGGRVLAWQIARSSGYAELDAEVASMIARAAPFPPLPQAWHADSASFQVPIGFSLY